MYNIVFVQSQNILKRGMDIIHFFDIPRIHPKCKSIHRDHFRTNETTFDDFSLMVKDTNVTTLIYKKFGDNS